MMGLSYEIKKEEKEINFLEDDTNKRNIKVIVKWICLLSFRAENTVESCDKFNEILCTDSNFEWFRTAKKIRIEEQRELNVITSASIRATAQTIAFLKGKKPDVEYVHGDYKYKIAPLYFLEASANSLRWKTGSENKKYRKKLGEEDCLMILKKDEQSVACQFLSLLKSGNALDQLHDITDAGLIGMWEIEENYDHQIKNRASYKKMLKDRDIILGKKKLIKEENKIEEENFLN